MHNSTTQCRKPVTVLLLTATALLFAIIVTVVTLSNNALAQPIGTTTEFLTYENAREGINLEYPSDWTPIERSPGDDPTFVIGFVSPRQSPTDQFAESFAINIETVPEDMILQEYTEIGNQTIRTIFPDAQIITSTDDITLSGEPAHVVTYSATLEDGTSGQITQVWTVTGSKAYVLTYIAESNEYQAFTEVVDRMISSFQITQQEEQQPQQEEEWLLYENATYGVSMLYPSTWIQQSSAEEYNGYIVVSDFFTPEEQVGSFASVSIVIDNMPQSMNIEAYLNEGIASYMQEAAFRDFQVISSSTDNFTLADMPAYSFEATYTDTEFGPQHLLEVGTIIDNRGYFLQYFADSPVYQEYLPIVQETIESFRITQPAVVNESIAATTANNASDFESARQQFLSVWQQIPFNASFSTFIDRFSDQGYGIYTEHRSNVFTPYDTIVLYLEPVGFTHRPVLGEQGEQLYQINLTASLQIIQDMTTSPKAVQAINQTILDIEPIVIVSHRQNTELFMTIPINLQQLDPPFPEGDYTITYEITDGESGQSFTIEKEVMIAHIVSSTT
jgi:hypothetical protein